MSVSSALTRLTGNFQIFTLNAPQPKTEAKPAVQSPQPAKVNFMAGNIAYEKALTLPLGTARMRSIAEARLHLERVLPGDIALNQRYKLNHLLCHVYEELGHMDRAERRFLELKPVTQRDTVVRGDDASPVDTIHTILDAVPGLTHGQKPEVKGRIMQHILSYDLPEAALEEGILMVNAYPGDFGLRIHLARLLFIHQLFDDAIHQYLEANSIAQTDAENRWCQRKILTIRHCQTNPHQKTAYAEWHLMHYHADALAHGSDSSAFFRCLSDLKGETVSQWLKINHILPAVSTPRGFQALSKAEPLRQAELLDHFPRSASTTTKNLAEALYHAHRSMNQKETAGAHFIAALFFREIAPLQTAPCCVRFCTAAAAAHESERQKMDNRRQLPA